MTEYATPVQTMVGFEDGPRWPCLMVGRWNGFAVPSFDRETMERVVAELDVGEGNELRWDGDSVVYRCGDDDDGYVIAPDADGRYVHDVGWCWDDDGELDPADPTAEQREQFDAIKRSFIWSGSRVVHDDGSHEFAVRVDVGRDWAAPGNCRRMETVARVRIHRDGRVELERVPEKEGR